MNRLCPLFILIILSGCLIPANVAADDTFRCESRLVSIGDTVEEVLDKCGKPDEISRWEEDPNTYFSQPYDYEKELYQAPRSFKGPIRMERWTYDLGSNMFIRHLQFEDGRLIKIETGEKGVK